MSKERMPQFQKKKVVKYEKNIVNIPEVLGRLIVAVAPLVPYLQSHEYPLSDHVKSICTFVYKHPQKTARRMYIRNFIKQKRDFFLDFIKTNRIDGSTKKHAKL